MLDLSKPHTVVVVTSTCRLPFCHGRLGPGVYHFEGDQRKFIRTTYYKKQLRTAEIYLIAGDTAQALVTIAAIKNGGAPAVPVASSAVAATPVETDEGDPSAMSDDAPAITDHLPDQSTASSDVFDEELDSEPVVIEGSEDKQ